MMNYFLCVASRRRVFGMVEGNSGMFFENCVIESKTELAEVNNNVDNRRAIFS